MNMISILLCFGSPSNEEQAYDPYFNLATDCILRLPRDVRLSVKYMN